VGSIREVRAHRRDRSLERLQSKIVSSHLEESRHARGARGGKEAEGAVSTSGALAIDERDDAAMECGADAIGGSKRGREGPPTLPPVAPSAAVAEPLLFVPGSWTASDDKEEGASGSGGEENDEDEEPHIVREDEETGGLRAITSASTAFIDYRASRPKPASEVRMRKGAEDEVSQMSTGASTLSEVLARLHGRNGNKDIDDKTGSTNSGDAR